MAPYVGEPSHAQQVALALAPKIAAGLSIIGSSYILWDVVRKRKQGKRFHTFHRLMIGLSVCDIIMSTGLFTSTWPMPVDTPYVWGAAGTTATCSVVGFMEQSSVAAVLYNGSLSVNYLLRIRYVWPTEKVQQRAELWLHLVPVVFGVSTMFAGLPLKLYNSGIFDCWIAPYPQGCVESWRTGDETTCERGDNASLYQWFFDLIPKVLSIFLVTINMLLIYQVVWKLEQNSLTRTTMKTSLARRLAVQSYLYVGALYITWIPVMITRLTEVLAGHVYYEMLLTISITIPLQGFWNLLVYLRPRWQKVRREAVQGTSKMIHVVPSVIREGAVDDEEEDDEGEDILVSISAGTAGCVSSNNSPSV